MPPEWSTLAVDLLWHYLTFVVVQDLIRKLLTVDPARRLTASEAIKHPWLATKGEDLATNNLEVGLKQLRIFNATSKLRAAIHSVSDARRLMAYPRRDA